MKRIQSVVVAAAFALIATCTFGQANNYKQPMTINAQGQITDSQGTSVGFVSKEKIIQDAKGQKIAFVDGQGNLVDARTNKKMGRMGKDGKTYYTSTGELMYTIKDNANNTCDIFDAKGTRIGNVHSSYKGTACALHCFQNKHTHMARQ